MLSLSSVNLDSNYIGCDGPEGAIALAEAFANMPSLTSIDLASNNMVSETGHVWMGEVQGESYDVGAKVMYNGRQMTVSQAPDSGGDMRMLDFTAIDALFDALPRMTALKELNLSDNALCGVDRQGNGTFTPAAIEKLGQMLSGTKISKLGLTSNNIGQDVCTVHMLVGILDLPETSITSLDLRGNGCDQAAKQAADQAAPGVTVRWDSREW